MNGYSEEPQEQITVQACLALTSVLAGRLYRSEQFNNVSSAYFLTLASTGVGKNYVKTAIRKLLAECGLSRLMSGSGNTSAGAVFSALFESPTHIQITDEFGKHLQMARKQSNGAMADAFAVMTEAYSDATGILTPRNYSTFHMDKKQRALVDKKQVYAPAMTLFAFAAPEQVLSNLTTGEIDDGFLNRLVAVQATLPPLVERAMQHTPVLEEYKSWALSIRKRLQTGTQLVGIDTDYDQDPSPVAVSFNSEALTAFQAFKQEIKQGEQDGKYIEAKLVRRWRENALRIATGLAVAACPLTPVITFTIAQWAIDYVRYYGTQFMQTVAVNVADSDFHRLKLNVEALIIKAGLKGMAEWELTNCSRLFASTPPNHRDQVLDALQREKIIEPMSFKSLSGRGKPRAAWVATQFIQESNHESA
jgi:hypothetical protein